MLVLAIDTATLAGSVALFSEERGLLGSCFLHTKKTHSERLLPMIDFILQGMSLTLADIDLLSVVAGPGSFTGIRIGVTTAKSLAQALAKPLVTVSTLAVLAENIVAEHGLICPILDARKQEVYTACYRSGRAGCKEEILAAAARSLPDLLQYLQQRSENVYFVGDAIPVYGERIQAALGERALWAPEFLQLPQAAAAAKLGLAQWHQGACGDYLQAEPLYLRRSEAELAWEKKHG